jgi:hypothetical protein
MERECARYRMNPEQVAAVLDGADPYAAHHIKRHWWEALVVAGAIGVFIWLAAVSTHQAMKVNVPWMIALSVVSVVFLLAGGRLLWKRTRFS